MNHEWVFVVDLIWIVVLVSTARKSLFRRQFSSTVVTRRNGDRNVESRYVVNEIRNSIRKLLIGKKRMSSSTEVLFFTDSYRKE